MVVSTVRPGCPSCGVLATKVHSSRSQRVRDIPGSSQMAV
ncbi:transposase family protein [Brachybacterium sp. Marseille-Q7125]